VDSDASVLHLQVPTTRLKRRRVLDMMLAGLDSEDLNTAIQWLNFHVSQLHPFLPNDNDSYPGRKRTIPGLIVTPEGNTEQYLVQWVGYGPEHNLWLPRSELLEMAAMEEFENRA
jgi:Chromo (CHRromatin Organisation MOdifier) domain